jgi:heterodisulfide reductase subunit A
VCCMYGIKNAVMAKELQHDNVKSVTVYYADIRAYGKGFEEFYNMSKERFGIKFIRGRVGEVEEVSSTKNIKVWVENTETGEFLKNEHELLVLCPGILPPKGLKDLASNLSLDVSVDGFISIQYPASNPVDTAVEGVYVAGCAESAKDIPDSVAAGSAAAMRASIILARGGEP